MVQNLNGFTINIAPNSTLASNTDALAAFNRAAAQWTNRFSDPITLTIDAGLTTFPKPETIGATGSVLLEETYSIVRNAMIADAQADDAIVNHLPTTFAATIPTGFAIGTNLGTIEMPNVEQRVIATKANFKALGYTDLDTYFGVSDGTILFSSDYAFDFNNADGVDAGMIDFETVAAHEIGHLLGFVSIVDSVDGFINYINTNMLVIDENDPVYLNPTVQDLFRFADTNNPATDPNSASTFETALRNLIPGTTAVTDFGTDDWGIGTEFQMSTGSTQGDGRQASHWKDDVIYPYSYLGIMDPTLDYGTVEHISELDYRMLDLMGWDIARFRSRALMRWAYWD